MSSREGSARGDDEGGSDVGVGVGGRKRGIVGESESESEGGGRRELVVEMAGLRPGSGALVRVWAWTWGRGPFLWGTHGLATL